VYILLQFIIQFFSTKVLSVNLPTLSWNWTQH